MAQVDHSGLSSQRDVFDAGPVRVICCDGQTGTGTGVFPMNSVSPSQGRETAVAQWLRCCATNRKLAGSIPDGVIGVFH